MSGPLGNEHAQNRMRGREKKRALYVNIAIKEWMSTVNGRLLFFWLVDEVCNADGTSFVLNSAQTAFNEGVRAVGVRVRERVQKVTARDYMQALNEELARRSENELHKETAEETNDDN
jgi:hypothetical protein